MGASLCLVSVLEYAEDLVLLAHIVQMQQETAQNMR